MPEKRRAPSGPPEEREDIDATSSTDPRLASCESCKSRKLKCDRSQPSCMRCQRSGAECVYHERKRPGFQAGFRQTMEERLSRVEQELQQLRLQPPSNMEQANHTVAMSVGTSTSHSHSSQTENAQRFDQVPGTKTRDIVAICPPSDLVYSLSSLYFRHIHAWFPILSPDRVFGTFLHPEATEEPSLLHYAIFGISLTFSNDPRLDRRSADSYWKYCKRKIMLEMLEDPSYDALEAMTILTLALSGMTNGPQVWGIQSVIVNMSVQLGLAEENLIPFLTREGVPVDEGLRRRLFWGVCLVDRYVSLATSNPGLMKGNLINRHLPAQLGTSQASRAGSISSQGTSPFGDAPDLFDQRLSLMALSSKIHSIHLQYTNSSPGESPSGWISESLQGNHILAQWFNYLPQKYALRAEVYDTWKFAPWEPGFVMLHAGYHSMVIYLNGPLVYPGYQIPTQHSREEALHRTMSSIQMLGRILSIVYERGFVNSLGWPFAWTLWTAGRFQLVHEHQSKIGFSPLFRQLQDGLREIGRHWQISGKYWRLLDRAAEEAEALNLRGIAPNISSGKSVLSAVSDLRMSPNDLVDEFGARNQASASHHPSAENAMPATSTSDNNSLTAADPGYDPGLGGYVDQGFFNYQSQAIHDWFNTPLYPTSGYQQGP